LLSFSLYSSRLIHHLHPFPTRRSSDLLGHAPHHLLQVHDARHPLHVDGNEDAVPFRGSRPPGGSQSVPILGTVGWTPRPTLPPAARGANVWQFGQVGSPEGGGGVLVPGGLEQEPHRKV